MEKMEHTNQPLRELWERKMPIDETYFILLRCTSSQTSQHIELSHKILVLKLRLVKKAKKTKIPDGQSSQFYFKLNK